MSGDEWFDNLKVGDEVVETRGYGLTFPKIKKVTKTFPSKKWVEVGGRRFSAGSHRITGETGYSMTRIQEATAEMREEIHRAGLIHEISTFGSEDGWETVATRDLEQIAHVISGYTKAR